MGSWTPEVGLRMLINNLLAKKFECCYKSYFYFTEKLNLKQLKTTKKNKTLRFQIIVLQNGVYFSSFAHFIFC